MTFVPGTMPLNSLDLVKYLPVSLYIYMICLLYVGFLLSLKLYSSPFPALFFVQGGLFLHMASPRLSWFLASDWIWSIVSQGIRELEERKVKVFITLNNLCLACLNLDKGSILWLRFLLGSSASMASPLFEASITWFYPLPRRPLTMSLVYNHTLLCPLIQVTPV